MEAKVSIVRGGANYWLLRRKVYSPHYRAWSELAEVNYPSKALATAAGKAWLQEKRQQNPLSKRYSVVPIRDGYFGKTLYSTNNSNSAKDYASQHAWDFENGTAIIDRKTQMVDLGDRTIPISEAWPQPNPRNNIPAQIRRLPSGEIQLKLSLKGVHAKQQAQAIRKALGRRVKSAVVIRGHKSGRRKR